MANESRVFRLPAGMSTQVVANAVSSFLSSAKGMEVQSAETTEGYVVQGRQEKDGWKTIAGMRMATTVQMIRMDDNLNVTVGQGEWSDKIGAGALGWLVAWPLAVTAGVGAYKQKKLPEEIFQVIEQCVVSGGRSVVVRNAGAELNAGMTVCPACKTQCAAGSKFCNNCGAKLENKCPQCGAEDTARKPLLRSMRNAAFPAGRSGAIKGGDCVCAGKNRRGGKKAHGFSVCCWRYA